MTPLVVGVGVGEGPAVAVAVYVGVLVGGRVAVGVGVDVGVGVSVAGPHAARYAGTNAASRVMATASSGEFCSRLRKRS
jgi:hypothetical protein